MQMPPKIIILCGIPCSGKTTWRKNYIRNNSYNTVFLSRDYIRDTMFDGPYIYSTDNENAVTRIFEEKFKCLTSRGFDIIIDNTHYKTSYLNQMINKCINLGGYRVYIKFFNISLWKAYWRQFWRKRNGGQDVPYSVIKNMKKGYDKIDKKYWGNKVI